MSEGLRKQLTYVKTTNKSVIGSSYEKYDVAQLAEYLLSTYEALGSLSTCTPTRHGGTRLQSQHWRRGGGGGATSGTQGHPWLQSDSRLVQAI